MGAFTIPTFQVSMNKRAPSCDAVQPSPRLRGEKTRCPSGGRSNAEKTDSVGGEEQARPLKRSLQTLAGRSAAASIAAARFFLSDICSAWRTHEARGIAVPGGLPTRTSV